MTGMLLTLEDLAATNPGRLVTILHQLAMLNPEACRFVEAMTAPLTPEMLDADATLTETQRAQVYDDLFEWHGDE